MKLLNRKKDQVVNKKCTEIFNGKPVHNYKNGYCGKHCLECIFKTPLQLLEVICLILKINFLASLAYVSEKQAKTDIKILSSIPIHVFHIRNKYIRDIRIKSGKNKENV